MRKAKGLDGGENEPHRFTMNPKGIRYRFLVVPLSITTRQAEDSGYAYNQEEVYNFGTQMSTRTEADREKQLTRTPEFLPDVFYL